MKPHLQFLGAAGTVTGSRTKLYFNGKTYLIDCGLFQGPKEMRQRNWAVSAPPAEQVSAVILTHAHLDHSGFLPRLVNEGFSGKIYCSEGTRDLCRILLPDAAHLEEEQAAFANASQYSNHSPALPLFTVEDADRALKLLAPTARDSWIQLDPGLSFRFLRAGHIIGASMVQFAIDSDNGPLLLTFSGDIGRPKSQLMRPPERLTETDYLVLESTYGHRLHPEGDIETDLAAIASRTLKRGGVLVIPAFAVGRAQDVLHLIRKLEDQGRIPVVPVYLDSPMACDATEIFFKHPEDHTLGTSFLGQGDNFFPSRFHATASPDESMLVCMQDGPFIVISASGMLSGGRILHHLKARLGDERNTVLFSGYQAEGSKGRFLQDNVGKLASLRIHHKEVPILAEIATLDALSAHADYREILDWLAGIARMPKRILLNHGSPAGAAHLANLIEEKFGCSCTVASENMIVPLVNKETARAKIAAKSGRLK